MELNLQTHDIFPTFAASAVLPVDSDKYYALFKEASTTPLSTTDRHLSSTCGHILERPEFQELNGVLEATFSSIFKEILQVRTTGFKITQSWVNNIREGGYSIVHNHMNSWITCVYWPKASSVPLKLSNPLYGTASYLTIPIQPWYESAKYTSSMYVTPRSDNYAVFFPSSINHQVETIPKGEECVCMSVNTFPTGLIPGLYMGEVDLGEVHVPDQTPLSKL